MEDEPSPEEYAGMLRGACEEIIEAIGDKEVGWQQYNVLAQRFTYLAFRAKRAADVGE